MKDTAPRFKLKKGMVQHDIKALKQYEDGIISPMKAMMFVEMNNDIKFDNIDQFDLWARSLGCLRKKDIV